MAITVQDNPALSEYELFDGRSLIGVAKYKRTGNQIAFTHTEVSPEAAGRGLGHRLVGAALDDARDHGWQVLPYCPFVAAFITENPAYVATVPAGRRAAFGIQT
ncbi:MAG: N-acetyltransferase [Bifidobacteriaceae bacterium]|jgi:predicted GNAT family acetyltransferase|nr:N-acetyltransferase [Bifidobacteriaceae bacterium]